MAWQRKIPFGYMVQNGETVLCSEEAGAIREIFSKYLAGASYAKIAEEMSRGSVPYHRNTPQWNKHMVKRILENEKYLGTNVYPRLVSDEEFLAVQIKKEEMTDYAPCPTSLRAIKKKAVCSICGGKLIRDVRFKLRGQIRWTCTNPSCGNFVHISDKELESQVISQLHQLANTPSLMAPPSMHTAPQSMDSIRIQNEINVCFNRVDINSNYIKTLIFAVAAERYADLPDPTSIHDIMTLQKRLETSPITDDVLWKIYETAVKSVHIYDQEHIELELVNGTFIGRE